MKGITSVISFCVFTIFATTTWAQDDVCDGEVGAAFGLCNAYCEAMDCDSDEPNANLKACDKVYENFLKNTGNDMPCELEPEPYCPCFNSGDLQGDIAICGDNFAGLPGLAGILYSDGTRACSGPYCAAATLNLSCAINVPDTSVMVTSISEDENAACQTLILDACSQSGATAQSALSADSNEVSSIPFIDR